MFFLCLPCACSGNEIGLLILLLILSQLNRKVLDWQTNEWIQGSLCVSPRYCPSWRPCTAAVMPTAKQCGMACSDHTRSSNSGCCLIALHYWRLTRPLLRLFPHAQCTVSFTFDTSPAATQSLYLYIYDLRDSDGCGHRLQITTCHMCLYL